MASGGTGYPPTFPADLQGFSSREITKLKEVYRRFDLDRRGDAVPEMVVFFMTVCICGGRNNQEKMGAVYMFVFWRNKWCWDVDEIQ